VETYSQILAQCKTNNPITSKILLSVLLLHPTIGIEVFHTKTLEKKLKKKTRDEVKQKRSRSRAKSRRWKT
jgi:hypothetical protein